MKEHEMERIAGWIHDVLRAPRDGARVDSVRGAVRVLCQAFPLYGELAVAG
jgi:glycine/serine hydroxymethyltransferase